MEEIVRGVHAIRLGYVNAFLVAGEAITLVDVGIPRGVRWIRKGLAQAGGRARLRDVLVTHHHQDHVGPLAELAPEGVTVWAHPLDAPVIRGDVPAPMPASRNAFERAQVRVIERVLPKPTFGRVDRELSDGEQIPVAGGVVAYHTPGHTAGHVSFLMPSKRLLFVGDAAANMLGRLGPPVGLYNEDHDLVKRSIAKIAGLDFDVACFGHGKVLKGEACVKFRRLAERIAA
jgi:glyoxylase-like metal-dependent hydrolase (beta-lactamase superfamily II)